MATTLNNYRVFCNTENKFVNTWSKVAPTNCPNNISDNINISTITVIDSLSSQNVNVLQSSLGFTNQFYQVQGFEIIIPGNTTVIKDISWPFNISIMTMNFQPSEDNIGDIINGFAGPNTTIGIITANITQNVSVLNVNSTVIQNIKTGYIVNLTDGIENIIMGQCIHIDKVNSRITCDIPSSINLSAGSYLQVSRQIIKNIKFKSNNTIEIANKILTSSSFPANTIARLIYTNNSNTDKIFSFFTEYEY
jgi:hypothetical protein